MTKTKAKKKHTTPIVQSENQRALRELYSMKHRELQRACIVRGMPSEDVVKSDHHKLVSFFMANYERTQDESLLALHDDWVEDELQKRGYKKGDVLLSPALRFSYVGDIETMEKPITPKPESHAAKPEKKEKSVIDEKTGVRQGTKKALTFELTLQQLEIAEIIKRVKAKFPEAEDKSIKIWVKKCKNNHSMG